ncbi:WYL domain-containing protein, partial [Kitasatospora cinereorecta]
AAGPGRPGPTADGRLPRTAAADTLAALQTAVLLGERMWIGYVNAEGLASQRVVDPVKVEGGFVTAYDHLSDEVRTFALHRITGVAEVEDSA